MPISGDIEMSPLQISPDASAGVGIGNYRLSDGEVGRSEFHPQKAPVSPAHLPDHLADKGSKEFLNLFHRAGQ
jgi:hypothetical protein